MPSGGRSPTRSLMETRLDERQEEPRLLRREDLSRGEDVLGESPAILRRVRLAELLGERLDARMIGMLGEKLGAKIGLELDETGPDARACASRTAPARRESAGGILRLPAEPIREPHEGLRARTPRAAAAARPSARAGLPLTAQMLEAERRQNPRVDAQSDSRSPITTHHRLTAATPRGTWRKRRPATGGAAA